MGLEDFQNFRKNPKTVFTSHPYGVSWSQTKIINKPIHWSKEGYAYAVSVETKGWGIGIGSSFNYKNGVIQGGGFGVIQGGGFGYSSVKENWK